jgi:diketogulonate reductase-like aldo/keto reductase
MVGLAPSPSFDLSKRLRSSVRLNNGVEMPVFGLGSWESPSGGPARDAVAYALRSGYRLIDTAAAYENEADVGEGIRMSGVPRDEVFVTTKLWNDDQGFDSALTAFEESRRALGVKVVDLYLLHWPVERKRLDSWRAVARLLKNGDCRSIGVSNFTVRHLEELRERSEIVPAVNQVEFSPFLFQKELLSYCRKNGIQLEAYSPLTRGKRIDDPTLARVAGAHRATPAQVLLRWGLQHDVVEIPKSVRPERIDENAGAFGFELSQDEVAALDRLDVGFRTCWDPARVP